MASHCLQGELDELEREEFFRLKKVQGNKKKHAEAAAAKEAEEVGGCALCMCYILRSRLASAVLWCVEAAATKEVEEVGGWC